MQNELDELTEQLSTEDFTPTERKQANTRLQEVMDHLQKIQSGQQMTYDDLMTEIEELKELYFLNKKTGCSYSQEK